MPSAENDRTSVEFGGLTHDCADADCHVPAFVTTLRLCLTPEGCTCGAPATTPRGMHHDDCATRTRVLPPGTP